MCVVSGCVHVCVCEGMCWGGGEITRMSGDDRYNGTQ